MIEVTIANFEAEVIEASKTTPVLVDFWAPWCGPCKTLGPLLERVETDYAGRFKLVKIDSDQEQQLAGAFGIRSIPTCVPHSSPTRNNIEGWIDASDPARSNWSRYINNPNEGEQANCEYWQVNPGTRPPFTKVIVRVTKSIVATDKPIQLLVEYRRDHFMV